MRQHKAAQTPDLWYDVFESAWGWVAVCGSPAGVCYGTFPERTRELALTDLQSSMARPLPEHRPGAFDAYERQLAEYFRGDRASCDIPLDLSGASPFFRQAWSACRAIPPGETRSYGWLADAAGSSRAARGAGQAMARNRVRIVVPCHRVISNNGGILSGGDPTQLMRARLLQLEAQ